MVSEQSELVTIKVLVKLVYTKDVDDWFFLNLRHAMREYSTYHIG